MTYKVGDIVLLNNGKSVYIFAIDEEAKKYQVVETDDENKAYMIAENSIYMLVTG